MPILGKKKRWNILTNILFCFFFFFFSSLARPWTMCEVLTLLPHGKRCCSYKTVFIYIYIHICIYIYTCIYNKLFLCQRQWKEYHNQEMGVEVWEKLEWYTRTMLLFSCLNQGQCCSHFVSLPLFSSSFTLPHPPSSPPSYIPLLWMLLVLFAGCLTWLLAFVQCKLHAGSGLGVGGGYKEAVMMSKALPFLFPLCIC